MRSWLPLFGVLALLRAEADGESLAEFPFESCDGMIRVRVTASGAAGPLNFLVDTGAQVSVLSLRVARQLNLKPGRRVPVRGVRAVTEGYWPLQMRARMGEILLPREFLAMDLDALSKACDAPVDGLLGADFFRDRAVQLDFISKRIRLLDKPEVPVQSEVLPLKTRRTGMLVPVRVNEQEPCWFRLDTGCASALEWVNAESAGTGSHFRVAVGLNTIEIPTTTTSIELGATLFDDVPTGLHTEAIFRGEAGLLGNGLLSRFRRVTIDAKRGRLILQPRAAIP